MTSPRVLAVAALVFGLALSPVLAQQPAQAVVQPTADELQAIAAKIVELDAALAPLKASTNFNQDLVADAEANRAYFLVEAMGRSAGWLAYGVAIAGEASLVISVEDIEGTYAASEEVKNPKTGEVSTRKIMNIDNVIKRIVLTMVTREKEGKEYGVIVIAEGRGRGARDLLAAEMRRVRKVAGDVPVIDIIVGNGEGEVPLSKLQNTLMRKRRVLRRGEMDELYRRLAAMGQMNMPIPKGPIPTRVPRGGKIR